MDTGIDTSTVIAIMSGTFALTTTVIAILVRQLLKAYTEKSKSEMNSLKTSITANEKETADVASHRKDCEQREVRALEKIETAVEKLRDQWSDFQKANMTMEADRGRRVDALFTVVDHIKIELQSIKPAIFEKLKHLVSERMETLRSELREEIREVNSRIGASTND